MAVPKKTVTKDAEQDKGQDLAAPGDRAETLEDLGVVRLGRLDERELEFSAQRVVGPEQREIHFDAFPDGGLGAPFCHPLSVGVRGDFLADLGQVILTVGLLDMGQQRCAVAHT